LSASVPVLLVEDEAVLLLHLEDVLEEAGFAVASASDGQQAIDLIAAWNQEYVGLITDIRLGQGQDGWEVAREARKRNPSIAVIYMTADSAADWSVRGVPNSQVLQKPFVDIQLLTALSHQLNKIDSDPDLGSTL